MYEIFKYVAAHNMSLTIKYDNKDVISIYVFKKDGVSLYTKGIMVYGVESINPDTGDSPLIFIKVQQIVEELEKGELIDDKN